MSEPALNSETTLQIKKTFPVSPEALFAAWTEGDQLKQWHCPSDQFEVPLAEVDVQVGGRYRIQMKSPDGKLHTVVGQYLEVIPNERLVYTWAWEGNEMEKSETRVTLEFISQGEDTLLVLTHELFPSEEARAHHNEGWIGCLGQLEKFLPAA